jgi:hypothetical protein
VVKDAPRINHVKVVTLKGETFGITDCNAARESERVQSVAGVRDGTRRQINSERVGASFDKSLMIGAQSDPDFQDTLSGCFGKPPKAQDVRFEGIANRRLRLVPRKIGHRKK